MGAHCSWCLEETVPQVAGKSRLSRTLYRCPSCGRHGVECRACKNLARWDRFDRELDVGSAISVSQHNQFCAEHRGDVSSFELVDAELEDPAEYERLFKGSKTNLRKAVAIGAGVLGGGAVVVPLAVLAAPAIGGAIGTYFLGLTGAAATSAGLATLGGGAIAAGGLGMAGGTAVIGLGGAALGAGMGALVGKAYFGDIKGFSITQVRTGEDPAAITINGFLSQKGENHRQWEAIIDGCFSGRAWYHVDWEAKRLFDLGKLMMGGGGRAAFYAAIKTAAKKAAKKAVKRAIPLTAVGEVAAIAKNPWHVALVKAEKTGIVLADVLRRCSSRSFVLLGHSLGARVVFSALSGLAELDRKVIADVHLLGGAVGNEAPLWHHALRSTTGTCFNYHSDLDLVLKHLYRAGTFFASEPIGRMPVEDVDRFVNVDVTTDVDGHMSYKPIAAEFLNRNG